MNNKHKNCTDVAHFWTPEQASAIIQYLDHLRDLVWDNYDEDIIVLRQRRGEPMPRVVARQDSFEFEDDISF